MSSIAQKIIDKNSYVVEFITSVNAQNEKFFAYLLLPADYAPQFREKLKKESLNLNEHGVLLASGLGHEPSEEIKNEILDRFPHAVLS